MHFDIQIWAPILVAVGAFLLKVYSDVMGHRDYARASIRSDIDILEKLTAGTDEHTKLQEHIAQRVKELVIKESEASRDWMQIGIAITFWVAGVTLVVVGFRSGGWLWSLAALGAAMFIFGLGGIPAFRKRVRP
ncbi:hypothetical protein [Rhodococcus sp. Leaf233]|uniref:hypothetical protein n=1 Tax=Rhodococcus sp. Leaf233 TaxID=1736302 RepID=UPI0007092882|nr:hypothetical protein [Rhodococcus sp. Leaf233]KQU32684.1 hypothetical protein ASH04_11225 [Rhodococcus sp. Leaf233]